MKYHVSFMELWLAFIIFFNYIDIYVEIALHRIVQMTWLWKTLARTSALKRCQATEIIGEMCTAFHQTSDEIVGTIHVLMVKMLEPYMYKWWMCWSHTCTIGEIVRTILVHVILRTNGKCVKALYYVGLLVGLPGLLIVNMLKPCVVF